MLMFNAMNNIFTPRTSVKMMILGIILVSLKDVYSLNNVHHMARATQIRLNQPSRLHMALSPIGPCCPFRSKSSSDFDPAMKSINDNTDFATEMARIQLDMKIGKMPDPSRLRIVAQGIDEAVDNCEQLTTILAISEDFQTKEYIKLIQAQMARYGQDLEEMCTMMRWQSQCMRAMANTRPPPLPPAEMDLMRMSSEAQKYEKEGVKMPSMSAMSVAERITSVPFNGNEAVFESKIVKEEYETLCHDHRELIEFGSKYGSFDAAGKNAHLQRIESIQERWSVFFARPKISGQLNEDFIDQCNSYLSSMSLDEFGFHELLKEAHEIMRQDAENGH
jgi:hypothetical protein